jgi:outer membrane lipoprotein-sorting protein
MTASRFALAAAAAGLAVFTGLVTSAEGGPDPDPIAAWVDPFRACLARVHSLSARFTQDLDHPLGVRGSPETGRLEMRRGGRMRLDYDSPPGRAVASDGRFVRSWDPATRLFVEQPVRESLLPRAFAFVLDTTALPGFSVRFIGGARQPKPGGGLGVIALVPEGGEAMAERVAFVLEPSCPGLRRVVVAQPGGVSCRLTFEDFSINPGIGHRRFVLTPPPGVAVVRP